MAQQIEKLGALLSDEEGRQRFLQLAAMLSGSGEPSSPQPDADEQAAQNQDETKATPGTSSANQDKTSLLMEALPRLLGALSGNGEGLDSKKINLVRALSPYLNAERSQYIDRAIRMASVASVAKDALGMLGR